MAGDYWLAYETSEEQARFFNPSLFISIYAVIAVVSVVLVITRTFSVTILGLKSAQLFFSQILNSILHAPMSFFDTTPSGRILSRVSAQWSRMLCHKLVLRKTIFYMIDIGSDFDSFVFKLMQASTDQTNVDIFLPFFVGIVIAMYVTVLSIFIVICQNSWPTVILLIPLIWLNIWYRV